MQINFTLRDMISVEETDDSDVDAHVPIWAVYFLGVEIAREPEPWDRYEVPASILKDKYADILGDKLKDLLGLEGD